LNLRSRGQLSAVVAALSEKGCNAQAAPERRRFAQRRRRLWEWAPQQPLTAWLLEQVQQLCGRAHD
jgi:hypothetical protein